MAEVWRPHSHCPEDHLVCTSQVELYIAVCILMSVIAAHLQSSWMASGKFPAEVIDQFPNAATVGSTTVIVLGSDLMFLSGDGGWADCFRRK